MDHSRMGGGNAGGGTATIVPTGGGTGNAETVRTPCRSPGIGGRTPTLQPTGDGTGNAEMVHPPAR